MSAKTPSSSHAAGQLPEISTKQADAAVRLLLPTALKGRFMRADNSEYACKLWRISTNNADISIVSVENTPNMISVGDHIIAYIDDLGRIEGTVISRQHEGFALQLQHTSRQQTKLTEKINWLSKNLNNQSAGLRRHRRLTPAYAEAVLILDDGSQHQCKILDLSLSGAAVAIVLRPPLRSIITLGNSQARVIRHFDDGIGIEFLILQSDSSNS